MYKFTEASKNNFEISHAISVKSIEHIQWCLLDKFLQFAALKCLMYVLNTNLSYIRIFFKQPNSLEQPNKQILTEKVSIYLIFEIIRIFPSKLEKK